MAIYGDYQDFDRYVKDYLRGEDAPTANPMSIFGGGHGIGGLMTSVMMLEMLEQ